MNGLQNGLMYSDTTIVNTPWVDFSNNSTIVGWSSFTERTIKYKIIGNTVLLHYRLIGTSNSTDLTFTLPFPPVNTMLAAVGVTANAGTFANGGYVVLTAGSTLVLTRRSTSTTNVAPASTWTNSGTKEIYGQFFYEKQ